MARPRKDDVSPLSKAELADAAARLYHVCNSIETAAKDLKDGEKIYVSYAKSLSRGLGSLEAVEPEIRRSMTRLKIGQPILPVATVPQIAAEKPPKYRTRKSK
jgi:hypothetical protein